MVERLDKRAVVESIKDCGVLLLHAEVDARVSHLRRVWFWATQAFAAKAMKLVQGTADKCKSRAHQATPERRSHGLTQAEQWLGQGLKMAGLTTMNSCELRVPILGKQPWQNCFGNAGRAYKIGWRRSSKFGACQFLHPARVEAGAEEDHH
jgi:hypothetical protein